MTIPAAERFWPKVDKSGPMHPALGTPCWPWNGSTDQNGYGTFRIPGRGSPARAHRVAWTFTFGPIADDLNVLHRCDNPPCCNPDHLFTGTLADNNRDMAEKGRASGNMTKGRPWLPRRGEAHGMAKLTEDAVRRIRSRYATGTTKAAIARLFHVSPGVIGKIISRVAWKHVT